MVVSVVVWHNPRCSKSRAALALLEDHGAEPRARLYLKDVPTGDEIREVLTMLGIAAHDLMRTGERVYRDLDLSPEMDDTALIAAMEAHPILIERPVAIAGGNAAIGRPPEKVLEVL